MELHGSQGHSQLPCQNSHGSPMRVPSSLPVPLRRTTSHSVWHCHGLGIADNSELNFCLDYGSHRRSYHMWAVTGTMGNASPCHGAWALNCCIECLIALVCLAKNIHWASLKPRTHIRWLVVDETCLFPFPPHFRISRDSLPIYVILNETVTGANQTNAFHIFPGITWGTTNSRFHFIQITATMGWTSRNAALWNHQTEVLKE